jgi:hypothetical protein
MDFVLDKEVNQGHQRAEEGARQVFPVFDGRWIRRAKRDTP